MSDAVLPGAVVGSPPGGPAKALPLWPVLVLFVGFPVFWLLGMSVLVPAIAVAAMLPVLLFSRTVRFPLAFLWWALFVGWAIVAASQLDNALRLIGYGVRMSTYLGATVVFVYVYNLDPERVPLRRGLAVLTAFFAVVVAGGWLGVLFPAVRLDTVMSALLPANVASNEYVDSLVRPGFAEVQHPYGSPTTFYRPSAPFAYTNGWGVNVALLVPAVLAALTEFGRKARVVTVVVLLAALVPAFATLNRGMYIAIAFGIAYASLRMLLRGYWLPMVALFGMALVVAGVAIGAGVYAMLTERLQYSQTNVSRLTIYAEAFNGAVESPLLGHGAPRPSQTLDISVGTQGQIWNVMFSYGFPALVFFVLWFVVIVLISSPWHGLAELWMHTCLTVALMTLAYYGYDGMQLMVVMTVAALALRQRHRFALRPPRQASAAESAVPA